MEVLDRIKQAEENLVEKYRQNQLKAEMRSQLVETAAQAESKLSEAQAALQEAQTEHDEAHAAVDAYDGQGAPTEGETPLDQTA